MIITILSPIVLCAASIKLGYILGQREYARQLSELARETVQRDIALAKLQKVIEGLKNEVQ